MPFILYVIAKDRKQPSPSALGATDGFYGTHHIGAATRQAQAAVADEVVRVLLHWKDTGEVDNCVNLDLDAPASGSLLVRHLDRVGVLAAVLDVLKEANINVQTMHNTVFKGAQEACARLILEQAPASETLVALQSASPHVLAVEWSPLPVTE